MTSLNKHIEDFYNRPSRFVFKFFAWAMLLVMFVGTIGYFAGWFTDAGKTVKKEFSASAMLKKYEWFKDASAQLDKKIADVSVWESKIRLLETQYEGKHRSEWLRQDVEQYNIWISELSGIKASYNSLAAEYNAAMAKFNYVFCNAGDLPKGAEKPLPREYKPYVTQ